MVSLPWLIEYWHIIAILVGVVCTIVLLFTYVRWFRKATFSKPQEPMKHLSTFYRSLAVICFMPIISPAYWIAVSPLFWDIVGPFLPACYHGAGIGMFFFFFFGFSLIFCLLCIGAATWLPSNRGRGLGLFVSTVFTVTSVFSLGSLYRDLIWAIGDPYYYWASYLLYILANLSIAIMNILSIYYLAATKHIDVE
jgi:hypothetical protein